jgi:hypothetical protein
MTTKKCHIEVHQGENLIFKSPDYKMVDELKLKVEIEKTLMDAVENKLAYAQWINDVGNLVYIPRSVLVGSYIQLVYGG